MRVDERGGVSGVASVMRDVTRRFEEIKALRRKVAALESGASKA